MTKPTAVIVSVILLLVHISLACVDTNGEGNNIALNATCYSNGSVSYSWEYVSEASILGNTAITYACIYPQGSMNSAVAVHSSVGVSTISFPSQASCVFNGCYVLSIPSMGYPTLAIPPATCITPLSSSPTHTLHTPHTSIPVPSSSMVPTPSPPSRGGDSGILLVWLPVIGSVVVFFLLSLSILSLIICYKRSHQSYEVDKDKINKFIASQPYDETLPEPEGFLECPSSVQPAPSLYSILLNQPPGMTEITSESEPEELMTLPATQSNSGYVQDCDIFDHCIPPQRALVSPTLSDRSGQSGYVQFIQCD